MKCNWKNRLEIIESFEIIANQTWSRHYTHTHRPQQTTVTNIKWTYCLNTQIQSRHWTDTASWLCLLSENSLRQPPCPLQRAVPHMLTLLYYGWRTGLTRMDDGQPFFSHSVILSFPCKRLIFKVYSQLYARDNQHSRGATTDEKTEAVWWNESRATAEKNMEGDVNRVFALLGWKYFNVRVERNVC